MPEEYRLNQQIRAKTVRLIDDEGTQVGVVPTEEALRMAVERGVDLVEVAPQAVPPVCKLMDYGRFKYLAKKKQHQARRKHHVARIKEIRFGLNIEEHDLIIKVQHARGFLERGDKLILKATFRGRQAMHKNRGRELLQRCIALLEPVSKVEKGISDEGRTILVTLIGKTPQKV